MKFIPNTVAVLSVLTLLAGCINVSPTDPRFQAERGKELYAQVNSFFTSIDRACRNEQNFGSPYCADQGDYVWTGALIGQHAFGTLQKTSMAIPKTANVQKGDIIAYHLAEHGTWGVFDRIAARAADQTSTSSCRWDGSHFGTGGVLCDGYVWNRDNPFTAD